MDAALIECVMNISEGRNPEVIRQIADSIANMKACSVLDVSSDHDHNRSVLTFTGNADSISEAAFRAISRSAQLIDLRVHEGIHPRIGAADVVPFVPLTDTTFDECVKLARELGRRVALELHVPVYLYEKAALRSNRTNLAIIRRGGFEKLREEVRSDPSRHPDFGEPVLHPSAGATVIGVRDFLIAFNVYLESTDVSVAREIARRIRERDGGLPGVKALGFFIRRLSKAQVSVNLTDFRRTSLYRLFDEISAQADDLGVKVFGSEIIGLVPRAAFPPRAEHHLSLINYHPGMVLEYRLSGLARENRSSRE